MKSVFILVVINLALIFVFAIVILKSSLCIQSIEYIFSWSLITFKNKSDKILYILVS